MGLAAIGHDPKALGEQRVAKRCERIMRQFDLEGGEGSWGPISDKKSVTNGIKGVGGWDGGGVKRKLNDSE
jgi:hypothetical protein